MSYILDALRRAESERANEKNPGLHDQVVAPMLHVERSRGPAPWLWMLTGAALVLASGLAWMHWRSVPVARPPVPVVVAPAPAPVLAPPRPVQASPAPLAIRPVPAPASASAVVELPARTPAPAPAPVNHAEDRVPGLTELPDEIRHALPVLHFDGAVYSDKPSSRILMVNGQLLHEGEAISPELTIEKIGAKGAVLNFRGTRFEFSR